MEDVWQEVDDFLTAHDGDYNMSFGLEYSSIVDWVADFTPRRNHPQAREYPLWQSASPNREDAIRKALRKAKQSIEEYEHDSEP